MNSMSQILRGASESLACLYCNGSAFQFRGVDQILTGPAVSQLFSFFFSIKGTTVNVSFICRSNILSLY